MLAGTSNKNKWQYVYDYVCVRAGMCEFQQCTLWTTMLVLMYGVNYWAVAYEYIPLSFHYSENVWSRAFECFLLEWIVILYITFMCFVVFLLVLKICVCVVEMLQDCKHALTSFEEDKALLQQKDTV